jgi:hypothetical protein
LIFFCEENLKDYLQTDTHNSFFVVVSSCNYWQPGQKVSNKKKCKVEMGTVLPTSSEDFLPDQPENLAADEKIRPHTIFSIKG